MSVAIVLVQCSMVLFALYSILTSATINKAERRCLCFWKKHSIRSSTIPPI